MSEFIWVLRNPKGKAIGSSVTQAGKACRDAWGARWAYKKYWTFGMFDTIRTTDENATRYEHAGYVLALEPHNTEAPDA